MALELQALARSFGRHLRAEGLAPRSITIYGQAITYYSRWLEAQGRPATVENLTREGVRDWLAELAETKQPGTIRTRYRGLFRFCGWLVAEDELTANPMEGISPPEPKPKPVPVLTDEELAALLKACQGKGFPERRDEALMRLLLDCGIRVSEACTLRVSDLNLDDGFALVTGKGDKVRPIYYGARTAAALDRYIRARDQHRWKHLPALFLTSRGAMSTDGARERVKIRGAQAGIADLHPHRFRHTWAHDFLMSGGQERDLKRLAGWTSDVMLERYGASAADARARAAAQRMSRGDRV